MERLFLQSFAGLAGSHLAELLVEETHFFMEDNSADRVFCAWTFGFRALLDLWILLGLLLTQGAGFLCAE